MSEVVCALKGKNIHGVDTNYGSKGNNNRDRDIKTMMLLTVTRRRKNHSNHRMEKEIIIVIKLISVVDRHSP